MLVFRRKLQLPTKAVSCRSDGLACDAGYCRIFQDSPCSRQRTPHIVDPDNSHEREQFSHATYLLARMAPSPAPLLAADENDSTITSFNMCSKQKPLDEGSQDGLTSCMECSNRQRVGSSIYLQRAAFSYLHRLIPHPFPSIQRLSESGLNSSSSYGVS